MNKYTFDCGCSWPILEERPGDIPLLDFKVREAPITCPKVWDMLAKGLTKGIFQLESGLGRQWTKKLEPTNVEHLFALVSILRPGSMGAFLEDGKSVTEHYCMRKNGQEKPSPLHDSLKDVLTKTYQLMIYQEDALKATKVTAGFNLQEADSLRKACIAEGSYLLTNRGPIKIEDAYKSNSTIILSTKDNKNSYTKIDEIINNGKRQIFNIRTNNGYSIELTEDHEIFTQDGWKQVKELNKDDFVIVPKRYYYKGSKNKVNKNLAIIYAYFIGEGCYTDKCEPKITNSDIWILNLIKSKLIEEFGEDSFKETEQKNGVYDIILKNNAKKWILDNFDKLKSREKDIPYDIINSYASICDAFIGSYFSAEGSVEIKDRKLEISSTSIDICKKLQLLLLRNGIHSGFSIKNSYYKNEPYISYRINITNPRCISIFLNSYKEYICPEKLSKIENIKSGSYINERFLVPSCFIKAVSSIYNMNGILGTVCGSIYNKNLTYDKVNRLNQIINSELLNDILESDYLFVGIDSIEKGGIKNVYDFIIPETECGYVNGILVHNCGKKIAEDMAKVKALFLEKAKSYGILTEKESEYIFGQIEASQRYSFNRSHAAGYGFTSYDTAYCKAHNSPAFFAAWIHNANDKPKPTEERAELVNEAVLMDITILLPDFKKFELNTTVDKGNVRLGLSDIKGLGEASLNKLSRIIKEVGVPKTWGEVISRLAPVVSTSVLTTLVKSGAFHKYGIERKRASFELEQLNDLSDPEWEWVKSQEIFIDSVSLLNGLARTKKEGGGCSTEKRVQKLKAKADMIKNPPFPLKDTPIFLLTQEQELFGCGISLTRVDTCDTSDVNCTCKEFLNGMNGQLILGVEIKDCRPRQIKNGKNKGKEMAWLTIGDSTAEIKDVPIFAEKWEELGELIKNNKTIYIYAERDKKKKDTMLVRNIWPLK